MIYVYISIIFELIIKNIYAFSEFSNFESNNIKMKKHID